MKRFIAVGCYVGVSILIGAATASAQSWGRPRLPAAGACFYEDINYGGRYFCANVGSSMEHVSGGVDDEISSIRVFGNAEVTVFRDSDFRGASQRFDSSVDDLRASGLNDRVTSYRVGNRGYSQGGNQGMPLPAARTAPRAGEGPSGVVQRSRRLARASTST